MDHHIPIMHGGEGRVLVAYLAQVKTTYRGRMISTTADDEEDANERTLLGALFGLRRSEEVDERGERVDFPADLYVEGIVLLGDPLVLVAFSRLHADRDAAVVVGGHSQQESLLHNGESPLGLLRVDHAVEAASLTKFIKLHIEFRTSLDQAIWKEAMRTSDRIVGRSGPKM